MEDQSAESTQSQHSKRTASRMISNAVYFAAYPYIAVGRAGIAAGSYAISAPIHMTKRITNACTGATPNRNNEAISDAFTVQKVDASAGTLKLHQNPVRTLLTAATSPTMAVTFGGQMLSDAFFGSREVACRAIIASGSASIRAATGLAWGMIGTLCFTTSSCVGLMDYSTKIASSIIPTCVTNAAWHGMEMTGTVSTDLLALSIGMPIHRLFVTFFPQMQSTLTQESCVQSARSFVISLFRVFGPQNAFYLLKFIHDTVRSEELHDIFLLAKELLGEVTDGKNLLNARQSAQKAMTKHKSSFLELCPSIEEVADLISMAADVTNEVSNVLLGIEYTEIASVNTVQIALEGDTVDPEYGSACKLVDHADDHSLTEDDSEGDNLHETLYCEQPTYGGGPISETIGFTGTAVPEDDEIDTIQRLSTMVEKGASVIAGLADSEHTGRFFDIFDRVFE
uniref:Uncharacterized protein AlNc14C8G1057 n=1 Tax=Albugo laibachii Nc14 TaxID=890382 RepID=F0W1X8_9STRA|nr:conserved hypothetical protein [Albugo laibachii Nc14]|eukprot:CCA15057.1 conserved hypothetical protein [Albugo laibachii Nc14]